MEHQAKKLRETRSVYLILRSDKPKHHNAPYHSVILCSRKHIAKWEAGDSSDKATVFTKNNDPHEGFLMERYKGFDIDYGHIVKLIDLFDDEMKSGFHHPHTTNTWELLKGATWWSYDKLPQWLIDRGVTYPEDNFTKRRILDDSGWNETADSPLLQLEQKGYEFPSWLEIIDHKKQYKKALDVWEKSFGCAVCKSVGRDSFTYTKSSDAGEHYRCDDCQNVLVTGFKPESPE